MSEATRQRVADYRQPLSELLPLARHLGVPVLAGTDAAGAVAREVMLLAQHGVEPAAAVAAATISAYRFLGETYERQGQPPTLVTYDNDPREDLAVLSSPSAVLGGSRARAACSRAWLAVSTMPSTGETRDSYTTRFVVG
jgi:imidazolonepropionase-like amidohydrolase